MADAMLAPQVRNITFRGETLGDDGLPTEKMHIALMMALKKGVKFYDRSHAPSVGVLNSFGDGDRKMSLCISEGLLSELDSVGVNFEYDPAINAILPTINDICIKISGILDTAVISVGHLESMQVILLTKRELESGTNLAIYATDTRSTIELQEQPLLLGRWIEFMKQKIGFYNTLINDCEKKINSYKRSLSELLGSRRESRELTAHLKTFNHEINHIDFMNDSRVIQPVVYIIYNAVMSAIKNRIGMNEGKIMLIDPVLINAGFKRNCTYYISKEHNRSGTFCLYQGRNVILCIKESYWALLGRTYDITEAKVALCKERILFICNGVFDVMCKQSISPTREEQLKKMFGNGDAWTILVADLQTHYDQYKLNRLDTLNTHSNILANIARVVIEVLSGHEKDIESSLLEPPAVGKPSSTKVITESPAALLGHKHDCLPEVSVSPPKDSAGVMGADLF